MPKVGYSNPYIARYIDNGVGGITYKDGMRAGRGVNRTLTVESGGSNTFRCDNDDGESAEGTFSSGELSVTIAELMQPTNKLILGLPTEKMMVDGKEVEVTVYSDNASPPDLGYGDIEKLIVHGKTIWRAVVLAKIKFRIPEAAVNTQGEEIEWQTDTITAKVMRNNGADHRWCLTAEFETESQADSFIRHILGIKGNEISPLTVISEAGSTAGTTSIAIEEELVEGRSYRYKTGADVAIPALYEDLSGWTTWDGVSDITATGGEKIVIAEVDVTGLAMSAGAATVTVKEE